MANLQYIVFLGAAINLTLSMTYVIATLRGQTKPNRITWFLWSLAPMVAVAAELAKNPSWAVLPVFMSGFCPFLILISTFFNKNAYWQLRTFDYICGSISLIALILWWLTNEPNIALILAILADALAGLPTIIKAWNFPETEKPNPFIAGIINAGTSFFAVKSWTFSQISFPIYLIAMCSTIIFSIYHRKIFKSVPTKEVGNG